ncbi:MULTISPECIES: hypothetical protein [unclassified Nocardioides]|uniref:hypothetical protein n=1 Tax=unclassified Nocardioides TaxID=2615069 RepID=UPI000ACDDEEF|nr:MULTISPECIES: hypothetical protein [unclassified Nocardioides]
METETAPEVLLDRLRRELLRLAKAEEEIALSESANVHYWEPSPLSAIAHRAAATLLRENASRIGGTAA